MRNRLGWATAAATLLVALVFGILLLRGPRQELPLTRLDVITPPTDDPFAFALSPDGRQLVFAATSETGSRLWRRTLDQSVAQPLAGTDDARAPFWAPDGRSIGFFADGKLKRLDLAGGPPQALGTAPDGRGATWSQDGTIVFAPTTASPLMRVAASGGPVATLTELDQTRHFSHRWPQALPDGRILFFALGLGNSAQSGVYLISLAGGSARRLATTETSALYAPPGHLLLVDQGTLVARPLNLRTGLLGSPVPIAQRVATDPTIWRSAFSVSAAGVVAHRAITAARRQLVWVNRSGARIGTVGTIDENNQLSPSLSPDGSHVAVQRATESASHIWVFDKGRDVAIRLRDNPAAEGRPVWSPDGRSIAILGAFQGRQMVIETPLGSLAGNEKVLVSAGKSLTPLDWSADGRFLLFSKSEEKTGWDIWALPLAGNGKPFPVAQGPSNEELAQISHDGRWVAYQSNQSGRTEVYVQPFLSAGERLPVSSGGGISPRWRGDSRELFYVAPDGAMMAVPLHLSGNGHTLEPGAPVKLFRVPIVGAGSLVIGGTQEYAVTQDGQRFLINMAMDETSTPITLVLNWTAALRK